MEKKITTRNLLSKEEKLAIGNRLIEAATDFIEENPCSYNELSAFHNGFSAGIASMSSSKEHEMGEFMLKAFAIHIANLASGGEVAAIMSKEGTCQN